MPLAYGPFVHGTGEYSNEEACFSNHRGTYAREYSWLCHPAAAGGDEGVTRSQQASKMGEGPVSLPAPFPFWRSHYWRV